MNSRRIAVLGAGANGAIVGSDLTAAGYDVTLIEQWPAHVEKMRREGVVIRVPAGKTTRQEVHAIHLCEVATLTDSFDVVLMLMKAYDSVWAAHLIRPYLAPDGLFVGVQNGMTSDAIAEVVGYERTLGCVIEISSMMFEPGTIERHSPQDRSWFAVGALDDSMVDRVPEVASLLGEVGTVEVTPDIRTAKWMKLVSNCCTLVTTAILGMPMLEAAAIPEMRSLMVSAGEEAVRAASMEDIKPSPILGLPADVDLDGNFVEALLDWLLAGFVLPDTKTTVLQDWIKGRRSEVDELNGHVVRSLRRHGEVAPINAAIVDIAHRIERGELSPDPSNLEVLTTLAHDRRERIPEPID